MIILLCGLSSAGKSTLLKSANVEQINMQAIKASELIAKAARPTIGLSKTDLPDNQTVLIEALKSFRSEDRWGVLDGHVMVETAEGPELVSDKHLCQLPLAGIIFFDIDAQTISRRRKGTSFTTNVKEIGLLSKIEQLNSQRLGHKMQIPHYCLSNSDKATFLTYLEEIRNSNQAANYH